MLAHQTEACTGQRTTGDTWTVASNGLPAGSNIVGLAEANGRLFAGTFAYSGEQAHGVFMSTNRGDVWFEVNQGFPTNAPINILAVKGEFIVAGTQANGVWRRSWQEIPLPPTIEDSSLIPFTFSLSQNYPNPFNPSTKIVYRVGRRESVELKVYDVLGREVATLVDEVKAPGTYEVLWNADGLAGGVYFYRIAAGTFSQTRKLILLR